jgi:putative acetyltransferase
VAQVRDESAADFAAIDKVHCAAFASAPHTLHNEHEIVRALRAGGRLCVSLVAEIDTRVIGHAAASPVSVSDASQGWYGLGPVGVLPAFQRSGIGKRLVGEALKRLRAMGAQGCVVLGEPAFYSKFGFRPDAALVFPGVPPEYFQVLRFGAGVPRGEVAYDRAFY